MGHVPSHLHPCAEVHVLGFFPRTFPFFSIFKLSHKIYLVTIAGFCMQAIKLQFFSKKKIQLTEAGMFSQMFLDFVNGAEIKWEIATNHTIVFSRNDWMMPFQVFVQLGRIWKKCWTDRTFGFGMIFKMESSRWNIPVWLKYNNFNFKV